MKRMLFKFLRAPRTKYSLVLTVAGMIYVSTFSVVFAQPRDGGTAWVVPEMEAKRANPIRYDVDSVRQGGRLFFLHCQGCHGYWGEGGGVIGQVISGQPANLLRLAGKQSVGTFAWKIAEGKGDMPSFRDVLGEADIWRLVNFIESLENEVGFAAQPLVVQRCVQCHGLSGDAFYEGWPNLVEMSRRQIEEKLLAHRSQVIEDSTMSKVTFDLTDEEIREAAHFFSSRNSNETGD